MAKPLQWDPWSFVGNQLQCPRGWAGNLAGWLMAHANAGPYAAALDALGAEPGEHVLEVGCGPGEGVAALCSAGVARVAAIDASEIMVARMSKRNRRAVARGQVDARVGMMRSLPWPDASFDRALMVNVLYFADEAGRDLAEVRRVLKPGGAVVAYVTHRDTMARWKFAGQDTHRQFDGDALRALFAAAGFAAGGTLIRPVAMPLGIKGLVAVGRKL